MLRKSMLAVLIFSTLLQGCALERINDVQRSAGNTADEASSLIRQAAENRPVGVAAEADSGHDAAGRSARSRLEATVRRGCRHGRAGRRTACACRSG